MTGVRGISMDIWESLKTMEVPPLDPKDIISEPGPCLSMIGNQNGKGYVPTPEERERRRQTMLGVKHTPERRRNQSLAKIGVKHSPERNAKKSLTNTGKKWYNNGTINKFCFECPDGFVPGMKRRRRD